MTIQVPVKLTKGAVVEVHDMNNKVIIHYQTTSDGYLLKDGLMWEYQVDELKRAPMPPEPERNGLCQL